MNNDVVQSVDGATIAPGMCGRSAVVPLQVDPGYTSGVNPSGVNPDQNPFAARNSIVHPPPTPNNHTETSVGGSVDDYKRQHSSESWVNPADHHHHVDDDDDMEGVERMFVA